MNATTNATTLFADHALLPDGWARDVRLAWDAGGCLLTVQPGAHAGNTPRAPGPLVPGMPNLHSHAFQRAFAGLTEYCSHARSSQTRSSQTRDSFWSWRDLMYRFANRITPAQLEAIACGLYVEMLAAGYTSVCEFHYLHHDTRGQPYADDATLSRALLAAAARAGIGITLLPVLYQTSGFGGKPPRDDQRRFIRSTDSMLNLLHTLAPDVQTQNARLGLAPHSLRAVPPDSLRVAVDGLTALDATAPIHIHIAEQTQEVDDCLACHGQRPVDWLLEHAPVDGRWCLVHATHMTADETARAARRAAVAGICPSTEANLGDGIFDAPGWLHAEGRWGVGSDSHACVNAAEELMLLEYSQRLALRQRNVLAGHDAHTTQTGTALWQAAVAGGAQAAARPVAGIAPGQQADFIALDAEHPALAGLPVDALLSAHVFASQRTSAVHSVWVGGKRHVTAGRHALQDEATRGFVAARAALLKS